MSEFNTHAYITMWNSAENESRSIYLPISIIDQNIAGAIHKAMQTYAHVDDDWELFQSIMPVKFVFIIVFKSKKDQSVLTYNVKL